MDDLQRVESIIWSIMEPLRMEIEEAQNGDDKIETAEPEAFMQNVRWLFKVLEIPSVRLRDAIAAATPQVQP